MRRIDVPDEVASRPQDSDVADGFVGKRRSGREGPAYSGTRLTPVERRRREQLSSLFHLSVVRSVLKEWIACIQICTWSEVQTVVVVVVGVTSATVSVGMNLRPRLARLSGTESRSDGRRCQDFFLVFRMLRFLKRGELFVRSALNGQRIPLDLASVGRGRSVMNRIGSVVIVGDVRSAGSSASHSAVGCTAACKIESEVRI